MEYDDLQDIRGLGRPCNRERDRRCYSARPPVCENQCGCCRKVARLLGEIVACRESGEAISDHFAGNVNVLYNDLV